MLGLDRVDVTYFRGQHNFRIGTWSLGANLLYFQLLDWNLVEVMFILEVETSGLEPFILAYFPSKNTISDLF